MHGIWNDFIILDKQELKEKDIKLNEKFVKKICDRNFWIWSDWIVIVSKWKKLKYEMYNPDGSIAEMCWNWIRCYMKYLIDKKIISENFAKVETWIWDLDLEFDWNEILVDMWRPSEILELIAENEDFWWKNKIISWWKDFDFIWISMWNPHAVIFLENWELKNFDLNRFWKEIESNTKIFPKKTNVEFLNFISDKEINMRVFERWAWETLACWTWSCASVVAWILDWKLQKNNFIKVNLLWWILNIKWSWNKNDSVFMRWKAEKVFDWKYIIN